MKRNRQRNQGFVVVAIIVVIVVVVVSGRRTTDQKGNLIEIRVAEASYYSSGTAGGPVC